MEEFNKGLYVTVFGMGLVFLSLTLIMFSIWGMERVFRQKEEEEEGAETAELAIADQHLAEEDEVAVAIGVALAMATAAEEQRLQGKWVTVASANGGASMWTAMGRQILMNSRYITRETKKQ